MGFSSVHGVDGSIRLFSMDYLGNGPIILKGHDESALIHSLAFSPDSQWLVTAGGDATVHMWSLDPEYLVQVGCQRTGRNFTHEEWARFFPNTAYPTDQKEAICPQWNLEPEPASAAKQ